MFRIKTLTIEQIIVILFSALPIVDSVNGILIDAGIGAFGTMYKFLLLGVLLLFALRNGIISRNAVLFTLLALAYLGFTIAVNILVLGGRMLNTDYPVKLLFNILTFALLVTCVRGGSLDGDSLYRILNNNAWLMIFMILIPKALGLGSTMYSTGLGYKAFFYSNNELSISLIILFYFSLYRITQKISLTRIIQLMGMAVCVLLLNTKSGMIACLLGCALFVMEYMFRRESRFRGLVFLALCFSLYISQDFLIEQIDSFMERQTYLYNLYGGSFLDTFLSGRTFKLETSWMELKQSAGYGFRIFFGNGFCSASLVEMDFIDIFFYLGAFGVTSLIAFLGYIFFSGFKNFRADRTLMRPLGFLVVVGFAFLAGHVFFMATAGCYFVLLCCFCLMYKPSAPKIQTTR